MLPPHPDPDHHPGRSRSSRSPGIASSGICRLCGAAVRPFFTGTEGRAYQRCPRCGITQLAADQLPLPAQEHAQYRLHQNDPAEPRYRRFVAQLATPLCERLAAGAQGLDYGCGSGSALTALLRESGHRMLQYDPLFAPDRAVLRQRYDFIACCEVAEHFHDPAGEFAQLHRLLRPGGWLGVMTGFQDDDAAFGAWHYRRDPTHVVFYRRESFAWLATGYGCRLELPARNVALLQRLE